MDRSPMDLEKAQGKIRKVGPATEAARQAGQNAWWAEARRGAVSHWISEGAGGEGGSGGLDLPETRKEDGAGANMIKYMLPRFEVFAMIGLQHLAPSPNDLIFSAWWGSAADRLTKEQQKGFNSLVLLVAWCLWKHRNSCVFDGISPSLGRLLQSIREEASTWSMAGARHLTALQL
ncbi:hypothetical protein ACP70R_012835 [Stipagrostis hirtigluma subsp. patula]